MIFIGLASFFGVLVCVIMLIVALIRRKPKKKILLGIGICFVLFVVAAAATDTDKDNNAADDAEKPEQSEPSEKDNDSAEIPFLDEGLNISDYMKFDQEVLFEYGNYFGGEKVVTVVTVYQSGADIKAKTDNNDGYFYSIIFEFENEEVPQQANEGDVLTIAGTIKEKPASIDWLEFLESPTVTLENCSVVGYGEIEQELKDGTADQEAAGAQKKSEYEAQIASAQKEEMENYISECQTVDYDDVARNPDNYDGTKVKITGKVIQVSEGLFDSVTLRVDCGGNVWYVTYSREEGESRILEGDNITGYGECNGVTSYTTIVGSQITIPSMRMEYYD